MGGVGGGGGGYIYPRLLFYCLLHMISQLGGKEGWFLLLLCNAVEGGGTIQDAQSQSGRKSTGEEEQRRTSLA